MTTPPPQAGMPEPDGAPPEPATLALMLGGMLAIGTLQRRRARGIGR